MTTKVIWKHYCKIVITFATTVETLLIEISKIKNGFAPPMMGTNLKEKNNINSVRNFQ